MTSFQLVFEGGPGGRHSESTGAASRMNPISAGGPRSTGGVPDERRRMDRQTRGHWRRAAVRVHQCRRRERIMILSGSTVRTENVQLLAGMLDGDEFAVKLERAVANKNTIVGLSLDDRRRITAVLAEDAPWGLAQLQSVLVKQLKQHKDLRGAGSAGKAQPRASVAPARTARLARTRARQPTAGSRTRPRLGDVPVLEIALPRRATAIRRRAPAIPALNPAPEATVLEGFGFRIIGREAGGWAMSFKNRTQGAAACGVGSRTAHLRSRDGGCGVPRHRRDDLHGLPGVGGVINSVKEGSSPSQPCSSPKMVVKLSGGDITKVEVTGASRAVAPTAPSRSVSIRRQRCRATARTASWCAATAPRMRGCAATSTPPRTVSAWESTTRRSASTRATGCRRDVLLNRRRLPGTTRRKSGRASGSWSPLRARAASSPRVPTHPGPLPARRHRQARSASSNRARGRRSACLTDGVARVLTEVDLTPGTWLLVGKGVLLDDGVTAPANSNGHCNLAVAGQGHVDTVDGLGFNDAESLTTEDVAGDKAFAVTAVVVVTATQKASVTCTATLRHRRCRRGQRQARRRADRVTLRADAGDSGPTLGR